MTPNLNERQKHTTPLLEQEDHISNTSMGNAPLLTTLPDVVLSEVFLWAIALASGRVSKHEAPLNLSQTCRSLRTFALSHRRLWACINLTRRDHLDTPNFSVSSLWLTRSGNAMLDIAVDLEYMAWGTQSLVDENLKALSNLVASQSRWRRLLLRGFPSLSRCSETRRWTAIDMSQLRELDIDSISICEMNENPPLLILNNSFEFSAISAMQAPIATQLVHLHVLGVYSRKGLVAVLDHCPALECLNIGTFKGNHMWPLLHGEANVGPSGTNNRLSHIGISGFLDLLSIFSHVRAPAFESLELLSFLELKTLALTLLSSQVGRSVRRASLYFCMSNFYLGSIASAYEYRDKAYAEMPNVTHLILDLSDSPLDIMDSNYDLISLSFEATGRGRFSKLEYLKLMVPAGMDPSLLENMLISRILYNDHFRAVIVTNKWDSEKSSAFVERERVASCVESGRLEVLFDSPL